MSRSSSGMVKTTLFLSGRRSRSPSYSSSLHHASIHTMPSYLSKNRSLSRWRASSTEWMNKSELSSRFHPPPSLWTTSMMSWLSWPSSECFPTPLTTLYAPSQSWTSLTSSQSSNRSETWTRHAATSLERPQHSLHTQSHKRRLKGCPIRPLLPLSHPLPPHHLPLCRIGVITLNATSALALVTVRPSASSRRS